ncbi:Xanthine dehydrogenase (plasmid) [Deinococcus proteolyticus MRP]|uniref:Xanthine dehydrogenase n=1 Tax=Deinococcus proteolyticus (strain ATCC 35074 / DSM 20540 / JCM 6276 / NBRC 101906 / NCIMB 13154 / VKM Ac-1939 / CCM 2703 / MRP) TaxID=693977 RepID=F0RPH4_DEIPM|nr:xanthine dehydrogenase family protein molybdopterin-binding subunit [Deinococcus proteolyticus]ADY27280.1 Xanthine dehydrogenase [Deinococcus proteolyticus MRP]
MSGNKFDAPAGISPLDQEKVLARPHPRKEGPLKVTGQATYAYEYSAEPELQGAAYGYLVGAGVARGQVKSIDTGAAEAMPGVLLVLTHGNMPQQGESETPVPQEDGATPQMPDPEVDYYHQAVAFVVAETFEQARAAAEALVIEYADQTPEGDYVLAEVMEDAEKAGSDEESKDQRVGDFAGAFGRADVQLDVTYTTPDQSHAMLEPHASLAVWDEAGEALTLYTSNQMVHWVQRGVAKTLQLQPSDVHIVSRYIGGGFGSKLMFYGDAVLSAVAARKLGRPVKCALTRPQIFNHTSHRPATIQRIRLGTDGDGRIHAIGHDSYSGNLPGGSAETASHQTKLLYAGENRLIRQRLSELHLPPGGSMRAPGEAVGMLALECAVDELAEKLEMDPIELRVLNDIGYDPEKGPQRPFSSRRLVDCLQRGAEAFGWERRSAQPGSVRDGEWLVGLGVASAFRSNQVKPSGATVRLEKGGKVTVETQMTDIGTGSYTILGQTAAEMLGVRLEDVEVRLGDSDFPKSSGSGGSWGANSAGTGVYYAADELRSKIAKAAGYDPKKAVFKDGEVWEDNKCTLLGVVAAKAPEPLEATVNATFGDLDKQYAQASFGAHFCEVGVHRVTGEIRVRRMLSVAAAGRIFNPVTARSQCLGGMTMGIGAALMEELHVDDHLGLFINHDLAEYHVPVHADIPDLDVIFLEELDDKSSPLKGKGVGELGICGVGAAVANAVYNASGVRIRNYPLTVDKVLAGWAEQAALQARAGD